MTFAEAWALYLDALRGQRSDPVDAFAYAMRAPIRQTEQTAQFRREWFHGAEREINPEDRSKDAGAGPTKFRIAVEWDALNKTRRLRYARFGLVFELLDEHGRPADVTDLRGLRHGDARELERFYRKLTGE